MKVTAAVAREGRDTFSIEVVELDEPRPDEILVRVVGVGLCHTDVAGLHGRMIRLPAVLGHEGAGIVEKAGAAVTKVKPGDRVAISFRSCGHCARCDGGYPSYCQTWPIYNVTGRRPDGSCAIHAGDTELGCNFFGQSSFATYCLAYETNVVKVSKEAPLEIVGTLGCGVQTGAGSVMRSLKCEKGSSLLVLGGGAVGLSAVLGAAVQECGTIIVLEPLEARRRLALELGATHALDPKDAPFLGPAVRAILPQGVDYVVDTTGVPELLNQAFDCMATRGVLGIVGLSPPETPVPGNLMRMMASGFTIKGIMEGDSDPDEFIPELIALQAAGRFPFDRLIRTYPLDQINEAIEAQHRGECVKVVLLPQSED